MKKIGLAVVTYKDNFGSALQTYATQYTLQQLGYETGIFEIKGVHKIINRRKIFFYLRRVFELDELKYMFDNVVSRFRKKRQKAGDAYAQNMAVRHQKYVDFNKTWLKFLPQQNTWNDLIKQSSTVDSVVVGSDQLWRPSNIAGGYFTLEFVPDNIKKIAYATSFGVSVIPPVLRKKTKSFLKRIDFISTREDSGKKIVKEMIGRDIPVVCDPTMLLDADQWMTIQEEKPFADGKYILCYFMGENPEHRSFAKKLKEKTGCKIIALLHGATYVASDENFADETPYDVGPSEFINLIRNAEYICTDSFHGTVFSILNSRKFFSFRRYSDKSEFSTNDRLHTLLKWTGLSDRMLYGSENVDEFCDKQIDYDSVLSKIAEKRKMSMEYFTTALNG